MGNIDTQIYKHHEGFACVCVRVYKYDEGVLATLLRFVDDHHHKAQKLNNEIWGSSLARMCDAR